MKASLEQAKEYASKLIDDVLNEYEDADYDEELNGLLEELGWLLRG